MSGTRRGPAIRALAEDQPAAHDAVPKKKKSSQTKFREEAAPVAQEPQPSLVAVIPMHGVVEPPEESNGAIVSIDTHLDAIITAFAIENLRAVVLDIDSPGGSPAEAYMLSQEILRQKEKSKIPVYAFIRGSGTSAAYWVACAADSIFALPVSEVESIGVLRSDFGYHKKLELTGVERRLITSGGRKAALDPYLPLKNSEVRREMKKMRALHEIFFQAVTDSRGDKLNAPDKTLMTGEAWLGKRALKLGLIDGLGDMRGIIPTLVEAPIQYVSLQNLILDNDAMSDQQDEEGPEASSGSDLSARLRRSGPGRFRM